MLLQVLDDGRLTDGQGRTVNFRNTIVIMTSNLGAQMIQEAADVNAPEVREKAMAALRSQFRPEFLNRIDEIILFNRLDGENLKRIFALQLRHLRELLAAKNIGLEIAPAAEKKLIDMGYDPANGARPLIRVIQHELQNPLAMKILEGVFKEGDTAVVGLKGDEFTFAPKRA
ncbi:MAG: AAA family ATPase [Planctomycetes bacterium]|nr:AAA family ATPase [Planctomycetota bacterium]